MKRMMFTNAVLLLSLVALTACPNNDRKNNPGAAPLQAPPPVAGGAGAGVATNPKIDSNIKSFQCEYKVKKSDSDDYFKNAESSTIYTTTIIDNGSSVQDIPLRSKFFGVNIGKLGTIKLRYVPAAKIESGTDTINLINNELNKTMRMSQSGFAGQEVRLESDDGNRHILITCKGTTQFKTSPTQASKTNLVCKGTSKIASDPVEEISKEIPLNSILVGEEIEISQNVRIKLDATASTITYMASIPGSAPLVTSTASLKSPAIFNLSDRIDDQEQIAKISVTCGIK